MLNHADYNLEGPEVICFSKFTSNTDMFG